MRKKKRGFVIRMLGKNSEWWIMNNEGEIGWEFRIVKEFMENPRRHKPHRFLIEN